MSTKKFAIVIGIIFVMFACLFIGKCIGYNDAVKSAQLISTDEQSYIIGYGNAVDPDCHIYWK